MVEEDMDASGDGFVDLREFLAAGGTRREFERYDLNGDGIIDTEEMEERLLEIVQRARHQAAIAPGPDTLNMWAQNRCKRTRHLEFVVAQSKLALRLAKICDLDADVTGALEDVATVLPEAELQLHTMQQQVMQDCKNLLASALLEPDPHASTSKVAAQPPFAHS